MSKIRLTRTSFIAGSALSVLGLTILRQTSCNTNILRFFRKKIIKFPKNLGFYQGFKW